MIVTLFVVAIINVATESLYERRDTVTALVCKKKRFGAEFEQISALHRTYSMLSFLFVIIT